MPRRRPLMAGLRGLAWGWMCRRIRPRGRRRRKKVGVWEKQHRTSRLRFPFPFRGRLGVVPHGHTVFTHPVFHRFSFAVTSANFYKLLGTTLGLELLLEKPLLDKKKLQPVLMPPP